MGVFTLRGEKKKKRLFRKKPKWIEGWQSGLACNFCT